MVKKMASINVTLLNKTDVQNFPQKYLFTLRTIWVFINVWLNLVVLFPNFSWSRWKGQLEWKSSRYLQNTLYWIQRVASPTFFHKITNWWQYEAGWRKNGFLNGTESSMKYLCIKNFFISKKTIILKKPDVRIPVIDTKLLKLVRYGISQFATGGSLENVLVEALLMVSFLSVEC